jgi:hypothetical protein
MASARTAGTAAILMLSALSASGMAASGLTGTAPPPWVTSLSPQLSGVMVSDGNGNCAGGSSLTTPIVPADLVRAVSVSSILRDCVWVLASMSIDLVDGTHCDMTPSADGTWLGDCNIEMPRYRPIESNEGYNPADNRYEYAQNKDPPKASVPQPPPCEVAFTEAHVKTHFTVSAGSSTERVDNVLNFQYDKHGCPDSNNWIWAAHDYGYCYDGGGFHKESCDYSTDMDQGAHVWGHTSMHANWNWFWDEHDLRAQSDAYSASGSYSYGGSCDVDGPLPSGATQTCSKESGMGEG